MSLPKRRKQASLTQIGESQALGYWTGYHDDAYAWSNVGIPFVDPGLDNLGVFAVRKNGNFGSVTTAPSSLPGITFTPASVDAVYLVMVDPQAWHNTAAFAAGVRLMYGSEVLATSGAMQGNTTNPFRGPTPLKAILIPGTTSPVTLTLQVSGQAGGTTFISSPKVGVSAIEWTLLRIA